MRDPNNPCLFCNIKESGSTLENELAYASYDTYPVTNGHCLIIPKRHIKNYFDLTDKEILACFQFWIEKFVALSFLSISLWQLWSVLLKLFTAFLKW